MTRTALVAIPALIVMALAACLPFVLGVYVYRDANRRGMNAILWALVAVLAPSLIGLLVYLLVRGNYSDLRCPRCDTPVGEEFVVCPNCGAKLRPSCPNCAAPVEPDWKVCPRCAQPLPERQTDVCAPVRAKDRSLGKVLVIAILIPVLLLALLFLGMLAAPGGGTVGVNETAVSEYYEEMAQRGREDVAVKVKDWAESVDFTVRSAYALRYANEYDQHFFLIYVPSVGESIRTGIGQSSSIFGATLKLELESSGGESTFFSLYSRGEKAPKLKIKVDGKNIPCEIITVDYDPALFNTD